MSLECITESTAPEALVAALEDPTVHDAAESEIWRRLRVGNKANHLAVEFILTQDRTQWYGLRGRRKCLNDLALSGLLGVCWKALEGLRIGTMGAYGEGRYDVWSETRAFLVLAISKGLEPYLSQSRAEVLLAGLRGKFASLPHAVRCDAIDELKKQYARGGNKEVPFSVVAANWGDQEESTQSDRIDFLAYHRPCGEKIDGQVPETDPSRPIARYISRDEVPDTVRINREELLRRMALRDVETLEILTQAICGEEEQEHEARSQREHKELLTQAIAKARGVSERQARKDKKALFNGLSRCGELGESLLRSLVLRNPGSPWRWPFVPISSISQHEMEQIAYGSEYHKERLNVWMEMSGKTRHHIYNSEITGVDVADAQRSDGVFVFDGFDRKGCPRMVPFRASSANRDSERE